jgi:predicted PurR-regulated permease PerM
MSFDVNLAALHIDDTLRALSGSLGNAVSLTVDVITGLLSGLISLFGLGLFVLIIAYFVLQGTGPNVSMELSINPDDPGYRYDLQRGQRELSRVWRAYLGGQITLSVLTFVAYLATLTALGVNETLALSILAALARFVPYVGAAITWSVTAVLVFFQGGQFLGLDPWAHTLVVLVAVIVVDQAIDHLIMPRVMGRVLGVHPAAVMIAVIAGAQLLGIVGLVLAAPVLASLWLGVRYALRKLFDADPWPDPEPNNDGENFLATRIRSRWNKPRA